MASTESALRRLGKALPPASSAAVGADQDERARAALSLVVERSLEFESTSCSPVEFDPATCPNCGSPCDAERSPYCGEDCREEAAFVRQLRSGLADGSVFDRGRQASLGQVMWNLLGGGYPRRNALVPEKARARVFERTGGKCESCGAPSTTFDHIGSACNRPINLRPMCDACAETRPFGDPRLMSTSDFGDKLEAVARRVGSRSPIRPCDDAATWNWRDYMDRRKALLAKN